jgi:hypothetical protein
MAHKDTGFDKGFVTVSALLALAGSVYLFLQKGSFAEVLQTSSATPQKNFPEVPLQKTNDATAQLTKAYQWAMPVINNKPVPLNMSVPIIMHEGKMVDLFTEDVAFRAPLTNKFLRENDLEYLAPNVGDLDPDDDGFSNLEEFNGGTNPKDAKSHPDLEAKLSFVARVQDDYILQLLTSIMPAQVRRMAPAPNKSVFVNATPQPFGFDAGNAERFVAEKFETKKDASGLDVAELTVLDNASKDRFVLVSKVPKNLAEYQADLEFRYRVVKKIRVKKGEAFYLEETGKKYLLQDVQENGATIAPVGSDGKAGTPLLVKTRS